MGFALRSEFVYLFQVVTSLTVYALMWKWYVAPYLRKRPVREELTWLIIPLLFQFVGITTLVQSVVKGLPSEFGWTVSISNVLTIPLSFWALAALRKESSGPLPLLWILTLVGFACGFATIYYGAVDHVVDYLGPHWYVGILYLPLQAICHVLILMTLLARGRELKSAHRGASGNPQH